ncbi:septal ring lytic transglycosylase RlpA family protein [Chelativorans sp. Marseille-P2723]|uniref:septal ring lytic transglycosylase RlpA family protein n=1 Tax=Chelativorans sp. Marseille-P2723 TaxID=2709133 RepID=UPI00156DDA84|nr:septal ring lytic transglycosylase RlpA family protein [Chelativorans sp. Marseille-P2723]
MTARGYASKDTKKGDEAERGGRRSRVAVISAGLAAIVTGCNAPAPKAGLAPATSEYFAESEYGVKTSPRVAFNSSGLRRGGGRYQVGKPYKIKGQWYKPKVDPDYVAEGAASWYGDAFHGRLTANGEVYDMTHLTAAHPTMPLPSYARVTNMQNGSSVLVRVNDRGPFVRNRVIDLSKRAAELLGYKHAGVANVRVEYVGPAPLHGEDDGFLLASYRPSGAAPDPSDGLPTGVMVAMSGPTPKQPVLSTASAFAIQPSDGFSGLPAIGPIVPDRPADAVPADVTEVALLSYAVGNSSGAGRVFESIIGQTGDGEDAGGMSHGLGNPAKILLGTWSSRNDAERFAQKLADLGTPVVQEDDTRGGPLYVATLHLDGRAEPDRVLRVAWSAGATDAFFIRD